MADIVTVSSQNTSVVHMKDLIDFSLFPKFPPSNELKKISPVKLEHLLNFDAIFRDAPDNPAG